MTRKHTLNELAKSIFSLASIDVLGMLIPIMLMPILTSRLGLDDYGQYLLVMTILFFGQTIIDFGVQFTGVRSISKNFNKKKIKGIIYSDHQTLRILLMIVYTLIVFIYANVTENYLLSGWGVLLVLSYYLGYILLSAWYLQATHRTQILLYASLTIKITNLTIIYFLVKDTNDLNILMISSTVPNLIVGSLVGYYIIKKEKIKKIVRFKNVKSTFNNGKNIFIGIAAPNLYNAIPMIIVGSYADPALFADYAIALKICSIIFMLQNVLTKALYPILSRGTEISLKFVLVLNLFLSVPFSIIISLFGVDIINFLLHVKISDPIYLIIISISLIFVGISGTISKGYLLPNGFDKLYKDISIRVSLISMVISIFLIYNFGVFGAALSLFIARLIFLMDYTTQAIIVFKGRHEK
ncbi:oligosaccharide flippase family protein [Vibrio splendidus]